MWKHRLFPTGASATQRPYVVNTNTTVSSVAANRKPRKGGLCLSLSTRLIRLWLERDFKNSSPPLHQDESQEVTHDPRPSPEAL